MRSMAHRIQTVRQLLFQKLKALGTPGNWDHIVQQNGMFCYTGLTGNFLSASSATVLFLFVVSVRFTVFVFGVLSSRSSISNGIQLVENTVVSVSKDLQ